MKKENENEEFIDISIGEIRIRVPNDIMSIETAKKHLEALYSSYPKPSIECSTQEIQIAPVQEQKEVKELPVIEEQKEVKVDSPNESYTLCPLCSGALKKKKIKQVGSEIKQKVLCKNRKCKFERDYIFSL